MSARMLAAMSKVFGKSYFPDAPENSNDADFQAGYQVGLLNQDVSIASPSHPITTEWIRRGFSGNETDEAFNTWKRGYWAGRYTAICQKGESCICESES